MTQHLFRPPAFAMRLARLLLVGAALAGMLGCAAEEPGSDATAVTLQVGLGQQAGALTRLALPIGNVRKVKISVWDETNQIYRLQNVNLSENPDGSWSVTLNGLPQHLPLTYEVSGIRGGVVYYYGEITATVDAPAASLLVVLEALNGTSFTVPTIAAIDIPAAIATRQWANLMFYIEGETDETLRYKISASKGRFRPRRGQITLTGNAASLAVDYRAPRKPGVYEHTIDLTDGEGVTLRVHFETNVVP